MKKILIVNNNLHVGGVQRALVDLLKCIHDRYEITLALFYPQGALLEQIPADVKILPVRSAYRFFGMSKYDVAGKPILKLGRSIYAAVSRVFGRSCAISLMALGQKKLKGFDVAISYLHDAGDKTFYGGCNDFVLRHTDAPKKITFLHCDYSQCGADTAANAARYEKFDLIAACSAGCREMFLRSLGQFWKKTVVVPNCQDYNNIRCSAEKEAVSVPESRVNILTVARLGREKGVERGIEALTLLPEDTAPYHYDIIGDGLLRPKIETMIKDHGLQERVTLLGEMPEPYGYMRSADLLLIPSVSEAAPLVIGEAACLGTPILSTRTSSAVEMIETPGYGWVCGNSVQELAHALETILKSPQLLSEKREQIQNLTIDNQLAVSRFTAMID